MSQYAKWWLAIIGTIPFMACTTERGNVGRDDIEEVIQPIGAECAAANPTVTFTGGANYTSPQTYDTSSCFKAVVIDINNYSSAFLGAGVSPGGTYISWKDSTPSSESSCNASFVRADLFEKINNTWVGTFTWLTFGTWVPANDLFAARCATPETAFTSAELQAGHTYRIAATARTAATSAAATRVLSVISEPPVFIH